MPSECNGPSGLSEFGASGELVIFTAVWFTKSPFLWYNVLGCPTVISDMIATLVSPPIAPAPELESSPSDSEGNGIGGGLDGPGRDPHENSEPDQATTLSSYRLITVLAIIWIVTLFATLTCVLESRWVHSKDWVSIPLPHILYVNSALLLLSSLSIEFARFSLRAEEIKRCTRWIFVTLLLGVAFVGGQIVAWQELGFQGLHLASNPGSFFFYLITGAHGLHLLAGIASLASVGFFLNRSTRKVMKQTAMDVVALYWHFTDGLWLYLLALLFITIQQ
jgi:cytochrome c oxidase subunit 3